MLDREPFLKAIFATPDDHLPRLVFADYLDETGYPEWAARLRHECETLPGHRWRGFNPREPILITEEHLNNPDALRLLACTEFPQWYGERGLKLISGKITTTTHLQNVLANPVTENVTELDLSGTLEEQEPLEVAATPEPSPGIGSSDLFGLQPDTFGIRDYIIRAVITVQMVEHLATMREVRRLTRLLLNDNDLDNDAARALARSPHLFRLEQLKIYQGSRFKARTWQQLVERFGEQVVE